MSSYSSLKQYTYTPSQKVNKAKQDYEDYLENGKIGDYSFSAADDLEKKRREYNEYPEFTYDPGTDPLYGNYTKRYAEFGRRAMEDEIGKASALSGGYANSYALQAGNRLYGEYMEKMNDVLPELYELAYSKYSDSMKLLENQIKLLENSDEKEYSRYRDKTDDYNDMLELLYDVYENEYKTDSENQYNSWKSSEELAKTSSELALKQQQQNLEKNKFENTVKNQVSSNVKTASVSPKEKVLMTDQEIAGFVAKNDYYSAILALDHNYDGDSTLITLKGLAFGIPLRSIKSYIKVHGNSKG